MTSLSLDEEARALFGERALAAYDRIGAGDPAIWIHLCAREEAAVATPTRGPLTGLLVAVKDNIDVAGMPTTAACPEFAYRPDRSAPCVDRMVSAGATVVGKTNMDQFATGLVGTRSPYGRLSSVADPSVISGGSSSGSALAVARGMVDVALGTDTAGSGRVPAALNGVVGLKPTRGLVSTEGVVPACRSLDCVSIFARSCAAAALAFGVVADSPPSRPTAPGSLLASRVARPRIGVPGMGRLEFFGDKEAERCFWSAVADLERLGATLVEVDISPFLAAGELLYDGPWVAERDAAVGDFIRAHSEAVIDPVVREVILGADGLSAVSAYRGAYALAELLERAVPVWDAVDVLALPTIGRAWTHDEVAADPHGVNAALGRYTNFVNLMDLCAISLPAGTASGVPFGLQLIAPALGDDLLLALGTRFEADHVASRRVRLAVVGAHLSGQPLNHQLVERRARRISTTATTGDYRLYALPGTVPPKPGLARSEAGGAAIEVEVWELGEAAFGSFVAEVPPPLGIGTLELADGTSVKGFICEPSALDGATEITRFGGWRAYRVALAEGALDA